MLASSIKIGNADYSLKNALKSDTMFSVNKLEYYCKIIVREDRSLFIVRHRRMGKSTFLEDIGFLY